MRHRKDAGHIQPANSRRRIRTIRHSDLRRPALRYRRWSLQDEPLPFQASTASQRRASSLNACSLAGHSCRVAGSKSAPLGHTSVSTSGSIRTWLNSSRLRSGPYISPARTGRKSIVLFGVVVKTNTERVRGNNLEGPDSINRMTHNDLFQWLDSRWAPQCRRSRFRSGNMRGSEQCDAAIPVQRTCE